MAVEGVGQRCLDVLVCAYWRAQDLESLLDWGERPVSDPNRVSVLKKNLYTLSVHTIVLNSSVQRLTLIS